MSRRLADLPPPPAHRTGWPWTEGDASVTKTGPRVTIVTPSFNQAAYLEATLRSVLLQGYSNIEYIVIDGGSTDGSRDILAKYAPYLDYWVSEPDRGQAHAINKGFARASGEIVAWLNSDDYYLPRAIERVVSKFEAGDTLGWVYGDCLWLNDSTGTLTPCPSEPFEFPIALRGPSPIWQPSVFLRRSLLDKTGMLDESFRFALDFDLWLRAIKYTRPLYIPGMTLAVITDHPRAKSRRELGEVVFESTRAVERYFSTGNVGLQAIALENTALAHLYLECAASAVLTRRSPRQALRWFARAVARDRRVLLSTARVGWHFVRWTAGRAPVARINQ